MDIRYLNNYDFNVKLKFKIVDKNSSDTQIEELHNLLKNHERQKSELIGKYDYVDYLNVFQERIRDGLGTFYFATKNNILYGYIRTLGDKNIYVMSFYSSTIKIVTSITKLLLDFVVYTNSESINKLIIPDEAETISDYLESWLFIDKKYKDLQLEWGIILNPDLSLRYDKSKNNLQHKIIGCFEQWRLIFNNPTIKSPKQQNKKPISVKLKSPEYEKSTIDKFSHLNFLEQNGKKIVCKISREDNDALINIREIIFYKNCDFPYIPKITKITRDEFCLPKYYPLDVNKNNVKNFLRQMLLTLDYLHDKGIFHQDIKPINMLQDKNENFYLIDFGISQYYGHNNLLKSYFSTIGFAVEKLYTNNNKDLDLFSLAISVIEIFTGHPGNIKTKNGIEYETSTDVINYLPFLKKELVSQMGNDGYELLRSMLGLNGEYISAEKALQQPYFNKIYLGYTKELSLNPIEFLNIKPFIDITFNNNVTEIKYLEMLEFILEKLISLNYSYVTFLLIVQIFRKAINKINIQRTNLKLYATASMVIGCIVFETDQEILNHMNKFSFKSNIIREAIFEILEKINYDIEFISYDFFINPDEENKIFDLVYILSCCNSINNETLKELSITIVDSEAPSIYNYSNSQYNKHLSVLENILKMIE